MQDVQTTTNTDKGKVVVVEVPTSRRTTLAQCTVIKLSTGKKQYWFSS